MSTPKMEQLISVLPSAREGPNFSSTSAVKDRVLDSVDLEKSILYDSRLVQALFVVMIYVSGLWLDW